MSLRKWDDVTRYLHYGLATAVTLQLLLSLIMHVPKPTREVTTIAKTAFILHMNIGMLALLIVLTHLFWTLYKNQFHLHTRLIISDIQSLAKLRLPESGPRGALPSLVHYLGLVVVIYAGITGAILYFNATSQLFIPTTPFVHFIKEFHQFIANFVWAYWIGHVSMAVLHWLVQGWHE